ncbi:helix-turn-helix domain-containing protein [Streptomyces tubercidicus]
MKRFAPTSKNHGQDARKCPYRRGSSATGLFGKNWDIDRLTDRERQVLLLLAGGPSNRELAEALGIAERTVKAHISRILLKLGQESRLQVSLISVLVHDQLCPDTRCRVILNGIPYQATDSPGPFFARCRST